MDLSIRFVRKRATDGTAEGKTVMANPGHSLATLAAEVAELRAVIAKQQETISALQRRDSVAGQASQAEESPPDGADDAVALSATEPGPKRGKVGRRGLLLGAAGVAGAAVATAAAVAIGNPQAAHAATGGNFILGAINDADAPTQLNNVAATTPGTLLDVAVTVPSGSGITAITAGAYVSALASPIHHALPGSGSGNGSPIFNAAIWGASDVGAGIVGETGFIDLAANGTGRIYQLPQPLGGAPAGTGYYKGESIRDINGELWLCTGLDNLNNPVWVKVAHLAPGATSGGAITFLSKPLRIFDSRLNANDALFVPGHPCSSSGATTVQIAGDSYNLITVPTPLAGAMGNVTVVNESGGGFLELVPSGAGFTGAANLAFAPGQVISNFYTVGLNGAGALDIIIGGSSVTTDVIIDLFAVVA